MNSPSPTVRRTNPKPPTRKAELAALRSAAMQVCKAYYATHNAAGTVPVELMDALLRAVMLEPQP